MTTRENIRGAPRPAAIVRITWHCILRGRSLTRRPADLLSRRKK